MSAFGQESTSHLQLLASIMKQIFLPPNWVSLFLLSGKQLDPTSGDNGTEEKLEKMVFRGHDQRPGRLAVSLMKAPMILVNSAVISLLSLFPRA